MMMGWVRSDLAEFCSLPMSILYSPHYYFVWALWFPLFHSRFDTNSDFAVSGYSILGTTFP